MQFVGVAWKDDVDTMQDFVDEYDLGDFPHVEDDGTLFAEYEVPSQPGWVFIDDDGMATTVLGGLGAEGIAANLETLIAS